MYSKHISSNQPRSEAEQRKQESENLLTMLKSSIYKEPEPARTRGLNDLDNTRLKKDRIEERIISIQEIGIGIPYTAQITMDRIGTDFMTNQPKYKERETVLKYHAAIPIPELKNSINAGEYYSILTTQQPSVVKKMNQLEPHKKGVRPNYILTTQELKQKLVNQFPKGTFN